MCHGFQGKEDEPSKKPTVDEVADLDKKPEDILSPESSAVTETTVKHNQQPEANPLSTQQKTPKSPEKASEIIGETQKCAQEKVDETSSTNGISNGGTQEVSPEMPGPINSGPPPIHIHRRFIPDGSNQVNELLYPNSQPETPLPSPKIFTSSSSPLQARLKINLLSLHLMSR